MRIMSLARPPTARSAALVLDDLGCDAVQLAAHLRRSVTDADWLDAYLLAAGMSQLVDDRLHPDHGSLQRAASYLVGRRSASGRAGGAAVSGGAAVVRVVGRTTRGHRRLAGQRGGLVRLVGTLAELVMSPGLEAALSGSLWRLLDDALETAALVADDVVRLPACFRSFDQHPEDVAWLARAVLEEGPQRHGPYCVVGVRTSGSYLAPLFAAALRANGATEVEHLTYRPDRPMLRDERERLRRVAAAGGTVVVTDDPPGSGSSLASTCRALARLGASDRSIVVAVASFPDTRWPLAALAPWTTVVQPWSSWSVHAKLTGPAVTAALAALLGQPVDCIGGLRRVPDAEDGAARGHVRARVAVTVQDQATGTRRERMLAVDGVGLGYFGRHALAVAEALPGRVPEVLGFVDGLLYSWYPSGPPPAADAGVAAAVADYVALRHHALPARIDATTTMRGRDPVWEVSAALLAGMLGSLAPVARRLFLEPLARRLLSVDSPSVVDGDTELRMWRPGPDKATLIKLHAYDRAFSHLELSCYDPVFDLAGAATDPQHSGFEVALRAAYETRTGSRIDAERWLLYRLAHLWRMGRAGELEVAAVRRRSAIVVTEYLARWYLGDVRPAAGPLCAVDLDGVLETDPLGYPVSSPLGLLSIRALICHGYRPVLVSGRSLPEVRDRCTALGLAGAVAEYGAAVYDAGHDRVVDTRSPRQRAVIDRLRAVVERRPDVDADPEYGYALRLRTRGGPLSSRQLAEVTAAEGPNVTTVPGQGQTDVHPAALDKSDGVRALAALLGGTQCALAVGDTAADLPMLALAPLALAPRNADHAVRASGVRLTRGRYQSGFAEAVTALVGHQPGCCSLCRPPHFAARTEAVLGVLGLRENGLAGLPGRGLALVPALARVLWAGRR